MNFLTLDLSTTATGWAEFLGLELLEYGVMKPKLEKGKNKAPYPRIQLYKMRSLAEQITELVVTKNPVKIVIEEINRGKNRLAQKTLDGLHYIVVDFLEKAGFGDRLVYVDSDGRVGWRGPNGLKLQLSAQDKLLNKDIRKFNKTVPRKHHKPVITKKTLSVRYVNKNFGLELTEKENDIADAIGIGCYYGKCHELGS